MILSAPVSKSSRPVTAHCLVASVTVALLGGCSYRMDRVDNPVALPAAWEAPALPAAATQLRQDWWTNFSSPVLTQLINEAMQGNPTLTIAAERLKQAERALGVSRDALLPDVSINASSSRTRSGGSAIATTTRESTSAAGQLRYDVDMWGGNAASYRASLATLAGTRFDLDAARLTLSANVATQYFQLLSVRARVAVGRENLAIAERLLRIVDARYRNGVARALDLSQQTTTVLQQRANLIPLEAQMRQTETAVGLLLGRVPQGFSINAEPFEQITVPAATPWLPSELLLRRPDLAAAETDLAAAHANIAVARANLLPGAISFTAGQGYSTPQLLSLSDAARTFSISGALSIVESVFGFRARQVQVANARSTQFIALTNYAAAIRAALKDVDDSLANVQTELRREESQRAVLQQAQRALLLAEAEYREGSGSLQEVLEAQRSQFSAQDQLTLIRMARLNSALDLYVALGGGWSLTAQE